MVRMEPYHRKSPTYREERNKLIIRLHEQGLTNKQIAPQVGLGFVAVQRIIRNNKGVG